MGVPYIHANKKTCIHHFCLSVSFLLSLPFFLNNMYCLKIIKFSYK